MRIPAWLLIAAVFVLAAPIRLSAQESKPTIRHHRVEETVPDDSSSPEVDQAETAMQHNDLATAETLLQKAVIGQAQRLSRLVRPGICLQRDAASRRGHRRLSQGRGGQAGCVRVESESWPAAGEAGRQCRGGEVSEGGDATEADGESARRAGAGMAGAGASRGNVPIRSKRWLPMRKRLSSIPKIAEPHLSCGKAVAEAE